MIRSMSCVWVVVEDADLRGYMERHSIALLSDFKRTPIDPPSPNWLGHYSNAEREQLSGLWCVEHVDKQYDPAFLDTLTQLIDSMDTTGHGR